MIADAVKSRGRSRHGQLAGAVMTVARRAVGNTRRPRTRDEKPPSHIYLQRPTEGCEGRLARIRSARVVWREGEHPALGPVPLPVPPARCLISSSSSKTSRERVAAEIAARTSVKRDDEPCSMSLVVARDSASGPRTWRRANAASFLCRAVSPHLFSRSPRGPRDGDVQLSPQWHRSRDACATDRATRGV